MTYPLIPLYQRTELMIDNGWIDISPVRASDAVTITRGRRNEQGQVPPGSFNASKTDQTGLYNNKNPNSIYYKKVGRGTLLRHSVGTFPSLDDNFNRSVTDDWTGGTFTWSNSGGAASDYDINGTKGVQTNTDTNVFRRSIVSVGTTDMRVRATINLDTGTVTGASATSTILARYVDVNNHYQANLAFTTADTVTFQLFKRVLGSGSSISDAVTIYTGFGSGQQFTVELYVDGTDIYANAWETGTPEPIDWLLYTSDSAITTGTSAALVSRRETGNTNSNLQFQWDNFLAVPGTIRGVFKLPERVRRRDITDTDRYVSFTGAGILNEFVQGSNRSVQSPLYRVHNSGFKPVAWWPLEEGTNATVAESPLPGVPPMDGSDLHSYGVTGKFVRFGTTGPEGFGTATLVDLKGGGSLQGLIDDDAFANPSWRFEIVAKFDLGKGSATRAQFVAWFSGPPDTTQTIYRFEVSNTELQFTVGGVMLLSYPTTTLYDDQLHHFAVEKKPFTPFVEYDIELYLDGVLVDSSVELGPGDIIRDVVINFDAGSGDHMPMVGHPAYYSPATDKDVSDTAAAALANTNELESDRFIRICDQAGIAYRVIGTSNPQHIMGPEPTDTFTNILQDIQETYRGIIREARTFFGLELVCVSSLYNLTGLALSWTNTDLARDPEPIEDNQGIVNYAVVSKRNGSTYTAIQETGPLNINDPRDDADGVGVIDKDYTVNPYLDSYTRLIAQWIKHHGTQDEDRFASIEINLARAPFIADASLFNGAQYLNAGSYLSLADNPSDLPPELIEQIVQGFTETITNDESSRAWIFRLNTTPARGYRVFILDTSRLSSGGSTLATTEDTTSTAWSVASTTGTVWSTTEEPYDWMVNGEKVTVTVNNDTTSPQDVTVTRSGNTVVKSHAIGETIDIYQPHVLGL